MDAVTTAAGTDRSGGYQEDALRHGIRRWENAEVLYNTVAFTDAAFPFVLHRTRPVSAMYA
jgi:hypothetical protein